MKRVSIQDLKAMLSATIAEAEAGGTVVVTRHGDAVAKIVPARVHPVAGRPVSGRLRPAIRRNTDGRYLAVLDDDRGNR